MISHRHCGRVVALAGAIVALAGVLGGCSSGNVRVSEAAQRVGATARLPLEVAPRAIEPADDYRVGPRDLLNVQVFDLERPGEISTLDLEVSARGEVAAPFIGTVAVGDRTVADVRAAIVERLAARWLVDPQVTVMIKEYRSRQIGVMGAVAHPGVFFLTRNKVSVAAALSLAGGLSTEAGTRAFVIRPKGSQGGVERVEIDLVALLVKGDPKADFLVGADSLVEVPQAEQFFVSGYVKEGGAFPYRRPTTVLQAIALAGGLHEFKASPSAVRIKRPTATGSEIIDVDLGAIVDGEAPDVPIQPGDSIEAGRTTAWAFYTDFFTMILGRVGATFGLGGL